MPSIKLPAGSVHYTEHGQGVPLVLLHANPGDSKDFEAVVPALSKTYRVLALDWPGYGQSALPQQPETVGVLFFYQVLREFLAALALPPACFIGNSLGGNAAARLAAESHELVRGLVLVAPGGFTTPGLVSRNFCKLQGSRFSLPPRCFASLYLKHRTATTRAMLERASTTQAEAPQIILNRAVWRGFATPDNDLRTVAPKIKAPTLLLFGKRDPVIPAGRDGRVAARCMPSAQFKALPCGHASFAEVPELFLEEVQPFLAACSA
ncbi:alpha/beta hydrolase [Silanimonas sp.]|jgi:pimeloyl-ACP methyl ester carboxylesterase|uniref:alpha/beta fold hydrolase n=1 Tax=Silanimonas sp. TaxID=1929290 RepID=UPI0022BFA6E2|nr:alpha/beta hydrolase [Silanimonas sp.]MCZ8062837.1 alpha/beta hydrolase [Silanimonas sp.]